MAGYSLKSLVDKLGIKTGNTVVLVNAPNGYEKTLGKLPTKVKLSSHLKKNSDVVHYFTTEKIKLEKRFPSLVNSIVRNGMIWISWPKGASKVQTDLNENIVREIGLKCGVVDVKVCAIDETWSGLKFVIRIKDRR
jgi:hypothetical protein